MKLNETQKTIVRQLFLNPVVCRKKLAHTLGLSNPGLTLAVRPLVDEGIIAFAPKIVTGRAGRNEEPLCLNPNFGYFAGIDVTVSSYHLVLISLAGFTVFEEDYSEVGPVLEKLKYFVGNSKVLNVCVTFRHYGCHKAFTEHESKIYEALKDYKDVPLFFENTVAALADIHRLYHYGEGISLLVAHHYLWLLSQGSVMDILAFLQSTGGSHLYNPLVLVGRITHGNTWITSFGF